MDPQSWSHEINKRRFIKNHSVAEELCSRNMSTPAMRLDSLPVSNTLNYVFSIC
jgi:hypothetical protein